MCVVETHNRPTFPHTLSIEVRAKVPPGPDVILMRHFGPLQANLVIDGGFDPHPSIFYKYQPSAFSNELGIGEDDDFRWILNLEGHLFHGRRLSVDTTGTRPGIIIHNGVYFFYTARKKAGPIIRTGGVTSAGDPQPNVPLTGMSTTAGASLSLDTQQASVMWRDAGGTDRTLPLRKIAGVSYEIYIDNSPLFEEPGAGQTHSEFKEYYEVLNVPENERFELIVPVDTSAPGGGGLAKFNIKNIAATPDIPCQTIVLETPE